jgi:hypothetical protein
LRVSGGKAEFAARSAPLIARLSDAYRIAAAVDAWKPD